MQAASKSWPWFARYDRPDYVDVREVLSNHGGKPIHWRLLTTHVPTAPEQAHRIVELYRKRWINESSSARSRLRVLMSRKPTLVNRRS
jgi:hypothetical protein